MMERVSARLESVASLESFATTQAGPAPSPSSSLLVITGRLGMRGANYLNKFAQCGKNADNKRNQRSQCSRGPRQRVAAVALLAHD
jgi:hypothetical protein